MELEPSEAASSGAVDDTNDALADAFPKPPPIELDVEAQRQFHRVGARLFGSSGAPFTLGRWELGEPIGAGGMGVVYPSYDRRLERPVAIKLLQLEVGADVEAKRQRMLREAKALARVRHVNVISVFDVEIIDSQVLLVMELFRGRTLTEWLAAGSRTCREILDVFRSAGEGLTALHDVKLVHRDFKPSNLLIGDEGAVRVIDLGLVCAVEGPGETAAVATSVGPELTRDGAIVGTLNYASPEQLRGARVTHLSDQFSFCRTLFEALYQARAFTGNDPEELHAAMAAGVLRFDPDPLGVPRGVRRVLRRGLAFEPRRRYPDMRALLVALHPQRHRHVARWFGGGATAALLVASVLSQEASSSSCATPEALRASIWSSEDAERASTVLARSEAGAASPAWHAVKDRFSRQVEAWALRSAEACTESHPGGEDTRRVDCLAEHGWYLAAVGSRFLGMAPELLAEGLLLVADLEERLRMCDEASSHFSHAQGLNFAERNLRGRLAQVWGLEVAGQLDVAEAAAREVLHEVRTSGATWLLAEAELRLGRALGRQRRPEAWEHLESARSAAIRTKQWLFAADASIFMMKFAVEVLQDPGRARESAACAGDFVATAGDPVLRLAELTDARGLLAQSERRPGDAVELHEEAATKYRAIAGQSTLQEMRAEMHALNARTDATPGKPELLHQYVELAERLDASIGPRHPLARRVLRNAAVEAHSQGELQRAYVWARQALRVGLAVYGEDSADVASNEMLLGWIKLDEGELDVARAYAHSAMARFGRATVRDGRPYEEQIQTVELLGTIDHKRGEPAIAARRFVLASQMALMQPLAGLPRCIDDVVSAAELFREAGAPGKAAELLAQTLALAQERGAKLASVALLKGELGLSYLAAGRRAQATGLLQAAVATTALSEDPSSDLAVRAAAYAGALARSRAEPKNN